MAQRTVAKPRISPWWLGVLAWVLLAQTERHPCQRQGRWQGQGGQRQGPLPPLRRSKSGPDLGLNPANRSHLYLGGYEERLRWGYPDLHQCHPQGRDQSQEPRTSYQAEEESVDPVRSRSSQVLPEGEGTHGTVSGKTGGGPPRCQGDRGPSQACPEVCLHDVTCCYFRRGGDSGPRGRHRLGKAHQGDSHGCARVGWGIACADFRRRCCRMGGSPRQPRSRSSPSWPSWHGSFTGTWRAIGSPGEHGWIPRRLSYRGHEGPLCFLARVLLDSAFQGSPRLRGKEGDPPEHQSRPGPRRNWGAPPGSHWARDWQRGVPR